MTGDLSLLGLPTLLQAAAQQGAWGTLTVERPGASKTLFLDGRNVFLVRATAPAATRLGEILLRTGRVMPSRLHEALQSLPGGSQRLGEFLMAHGATSQEDIDQALTEQAMEEICDLFSWTDARFEFREEAPSSEERRLPIPVTAVILEAARRIDEQTRARSIMPSRDLVPIRVLTELPYDDPSINPFVLKMVVRLADGRQSVAEILKQCPFPGFVVECTLSTLVERGAYRLEGSRAAPPQAPEPPVPVAPRAMVVTAFPTFGQALSGALNAAGIRASLHPDDVDLRRLAESMKPDVVVLDSVDCRRDLELCRRLAPTPVVMLISNPSRDAVLLAVRSGAREVLIKPVATDALVRRLRELTSRAA